MIGLCCFVIKQSGWSFSYKSFIVMVIIWEQLTLEHKTLNYNVAILQILQCCLQSGPFNTCTVWSKLTSSTETSTVFRFYKENMTLGEHWHIRIVTNFTLSGCDPREVSINYNSCLISTFLQWIHHVLFCGVGRLLQVNASRSYNT